MASLNVKLNDIRDFLVGNSNAYINIIKYKDNEISLLGNTFFLGINESSYTNGYLSSSKIKRFSYTFRESFT